MSSLCFIPSLILGKVLERSTPCTENVGVLMKNHLECWVFKMIGVCLRTLVFDDI